MIFFQKRTVVLFFAVCLLVSGCSASKLPVETITIRTADGTDISVRAEIAADSESRSNGFMFRKHIPDGTGMLFVFEKDQILDFWMKNTPHPLSIAYIDRSGRIRDIFDMTPYSLANVTSTVSVRYALEVPQGWFQKTGIKPGDFVDVSFLRN